ncbi:acyl transferase-like protein, putative [Bodo saltans]|uniref:[acyl-carrier-protein] S-malonyltransferase n=1 Tax=Bodo saltans TaxID=75058 RepID=A0A0S4IR28_BODSA|nr:acyl transferase-like protein, putative [Bodo saltans]|eukprot:CUE66393.1 acyl transferase-like protein, putative [Bodo saltans]
MSATATSRALLFCGQGSHKKGMAMDVIAKHGSSAARVFNTTSDTMMQSYHVHLGSLIKDAPVDMMIDKSALSHVSVNRPFGLANTALTGESSRDLVKVYDKQGLMNITAFAQAAMVSAQLALLEDAREFKTLAMDNVRCVAGHSLGEFTALSSLGVFPPDVLVDLVWRRGVFMQKAVDVYASVSRRHEFLMYACNPKRAQLDTLVSAEEQGNNKSEAERITAGDVFCVLVELVAQALQTTTSFVELVNVNVEGEQYVVAGDAVALAALGKVLDPQFRANVPTNAAGGVSMQQVVRHAVEAVRVDQADGITERPNLPPPPDFVPSSGKRYGKPNIFKRVLSGIDDGKTPALDRLTHLTLEDDGRSGLKRKSWYIPLTVATPFHSSLLRRTVDDLYPLLLQALPSDNVIEKVMNCSGALSGSGQDPRPSWVTNLTGTTFGTHAPFREEAADYLSAMNVGEVAHNGKFSIPTSQPQMLEVLKSSQSPRELIAVVLAGQAAHPVQWVNSMETMFSTVGVTAVTEIAPQPTLSEMVKRSGFLR